MAQLQELTRLLLAAGDTVDPDGNGSHFLFTDERSSLISKHWTGTEFGKKELITDRIRPYSSAAYILTDDTRIVFCISDDSSFRAIKYDDDEEDWLDIEGFPHFQVHPEGHIAGFVGPDFHAYALFQDPSGQLVSLNDSWTSSVLPTEAAVGTPIAVGKDNLLHFIKQSSDGTFGEDTIFAQCVFEGKLKNLLLSYNEESKKFQAFVLTEKKGIFAVDQDTEARLSLGRVGEDGSFVPGTDAEASMTIWWWRSGRIRKVRYRF